MNTTIQPGSSAPSLPTPTRETIVLGGVPYTHRPSVLTHVREAHRDFPEFITIDGTGRLRVQWANYVMAPEGNHWKFTLMAHAAGVLTYRERQCLRIVSTTYPDERWGPLLDGEELNFNPRFGGDAWTFLQMQLILCSTEQNTLNPRLKLIKEP